MTPRVELADARALPLESYSVPLIVTSPPYGLDIRYELGDVPAEEWGEFTRSWLAEALRVASPDGRLAVNVPFDANKPTSRPVWVEMCAAALAVGWHYRSVIVWHKPTNAPRTSWGSWLRPSAPNIVTRDEAIGLFYKGERWKRRGDGASDVTREEFMSWTQGSWTIPPETRAFMRYPAAFPEELPRRLIKLLTYPGEAVLDPFSGSGTTAIAAHRLERVPLAFDISPRAVAITEQRLAQAELLLERRAPDPCHIAPKHAAGGVTWELISPGS